MHIICIYSRIAEPPEVKNIHRNAKIITNERRNLSIYRR